MAKSSIPRFVVFTAFSISAATLAACDAKPAPSSPPVQSTLSATATPTDSSDELPAQSELDLREANVVAVSFEHLQGESYRFDVTLQHDDEGETPNYANWWQVEDTEGNLLERRVLTHAHSNEPFTRSITVTVPTHVNIIIVRGHDMLHGFGGQAMKVDMITGEAVPFDEGSNPSQ